MPPPVPTVSVTVQSNGAAVALTVPQQNVQLKVGVAIGGTVDLPLASSSPQTLQTNLVGGPLLEASGLVAAVGNIPIAMPIPVVTLGTASAVQATVPGGSTSTVTVTTDATYGPWDTWFVKMLCVVGGTIGTTGIIVQFSADAGRSYGPPISIGTATSFYCGNGSLTSRVVGGSGLSFAFGAGTMVAGDYWQLSTVGPQGNAAGITAALAAFQKSQYGVAGVGSMHIVGDMMHGGSTTDDISSVQAQLTTGVGIYQFDRAIVELRDALVPTAWGGSGETEATWIAALQTAVLGLTAEERICADAGNYNIRTPFAHPTFGLPLYRRNLAWAHSVIRTQLQPQERAGRIRNANQPYSQITVNAATDPTDGFAYHDERTTPGLAISRIACAMTWPGKGAGFFQSTEALLCALGSQVDELVIGNVFDIGCDLGYQLAVENISDDLQLQANGTLDPIALNQVQGEIDQGLIEGMVAPNWVSSLTVTIDPTANVLSTGNIPVTVSLLRKGYVDKVSLTLALANGGVGT
jgi:hypothetical protein